MPSASWSWRARAGSGFDRRWFDCDRPAHPTAGWAGRHRLCDRRWQARPVRPTSDPLYPRSEEMNEFVIDIYGDMVLPYGWK